MITIALAPCATIELTSEMDFSSEPPPTTTICLTFEHFAASERTAAYDSCDHALMPKPSCTPSVICFVPQNGRFEKTPDVAVSWASVGHVTAPARANAVVAATATTSNASTGRASKRLRRVRSDFAPVLDFPDIERPPRPRLRVVGPARRAGATPETSRPEWGRRPRTVVAIETTGSHRLLPRARPARAGGCAGWFAAGATAGSRPPSRAR